MRVTSLTQAIRWHAIFSDLCAFLCAGRRDCRHIDDHPGAGNLMSWHITRLRRGEGRILIA